MIFEIKTIPFLPEYNGFSRKITVDFYSKLKHSLKFQQDLESRGLILPTLEMKYYTNNPIFKRHVKMHTILSAN
jgi:hypothetical protein